MGFLSEIERRALGAICETLLAQAELNGKNRLAAYSPADSKLLERLEEAYERIANESEKRELKLLLNAMERGLFNALFGASPKAFSSMSISERESILFAWASSRFELRRKAFQGIKRLALFIAYSNLPDDAKHPAWEDMAYPGAAGAGDSPKTIQPFVIQDGRTLSCDVLVIGSGAGGGVMAGELSAAGYDVIVVEKGEYFAENDFRGNELEATEKMFEKYGSLTTADTSMMVLAGSVLGGGTTVNWSASLRTPDYVLNEWAKDYGISAAASPVWQQSLDAVLARSNVSCDESHLNANNGIFARGVEKLGWNLETIPRNVKGCEDCGFCNYGCAFGAKQGTLKTYLQDAYERGTRIIVKANLRRVMHEAGQVKGAVLEAEDAKGGIHLLSIKAKVVVVSAGTIHSPAILKRSGLQNPNIGKHLHLHPATVIFSIFNEPIRTWQGVPMSRVSKQFMDLDGRGYGVALEVAPAHPGLIAATLPWRSAASHKAILGNMANMANVIIINRDYYGGTVTIDRNGEAVLNYRLHEYDKRHLMRGILEALRVHHAAGASEIHAPHAKLLRYENKGNDSEFLRFLRQVEDEGLAPNAFPLFSAHQMSSARMAGSPELGACKPSGETWEVKNLFVADGSSMPTATGVNPMMSIMATAHYIAQEVKAALN
jgi:choline dehydrogenase-like flavoprotein